MNSAETIKRALVAALQKLDVAVTVDSVVLEHPAELINGDYSTSAALAYAKIKATSPRALADEIVQALGDVDGVSKIEIAGPGFINFHLAAETIASTVQSAQDEEAWGSNSDQAGKTIMVEYTDPNPFKEFHIGHLMSNAIGESIARLLEVSGAKVLRANYQGDVGLHVAKAIWGYRNLVVEAGEPVNEIARWGMAYKFGSAQYENSERIKGEIDQLGLEIFANSDAFGEYAEGRELSLKHFEELYKILGTSFDYYFFESVTGPMGVEIVKAHPEVFEQSEGATVFKAEQYGLHTRVFLNRLGLPTYEAKDLGLAQLKTATTNFDTSITVTAQEQAEYFKVVKKAMELIFPDIAKKIVHVSHGMMRFADGKMSSRTGNVITGESLLNDLVESAHERAAESRADDKIQLAQDIAVAAIKYQVLRQTSGKNIVFDRERALSLEGDSGPYLQYTYARTNAVLERAAAEGVAAQLNVNAEAGEVMRLMCRFPEVVAHSSHELEPHYVAQYLLQLAAAFNSWYAQEHILDGTPAAAHKLTVTDAVRKTLKNGLWILGIPAPNKM